MADVFLSYARHDEGKVRQIADLLVAEGYDVWWDADMPPHRAYSDVIEEEVGRAKAVLVVWSKESIASEWVRAEADMGRNARKLVQLSLDETPPPLPFNQIHVVSLAKWHGQREDAEWQRILRSLAEILGRPMPPPSPAVRAKSILARLSGLLRSWRRLAWIAAGLAAPVLLAAGGFAGWTYARTQAAALVKPGVGNTGAAGTAATLKPLRPDSTIGMVFPDSDRRPLTEEELEPLTIEQLSLARNEIFARHGHYFGKSYFRAYYSTMDWYIPTVRDVRPEDLNPSELYNRDLILKVEAARRLLGQQVDPEKVRALIPRVPDP
jgi:hypothetical protein